MQKPKFYSILPLKILKKHAFLWLLYAILILMAAYFSYQSLMHNDFSLGADFGVFGDSIGGIWNPIVTIGGFVWLKKSLDAQKETLLLQKHELQAQKYEIKLDNFRADFNKLIDTFALHSKQAEIRMKDFHNFINYRLMVGSKRIDLIYNLHDMQAENLNNIAKASLQINQKDILFFSKTVELENFLMSFISIAEFIEEANISDQDKRYFHKLLMMNINKHAKYSLFMLGLCNSSLCALITNQAEFKAIASFELDKSIIFNFIDNKPVTEDANMAKHWLDIPFKLIQEEQKLYLQIQSPYLLNTSERRCSI